jgi:hypothetical protein
MNRRVELPVWASIFSFAMRLIPIASSLYTLHEGRQVREEGISVSPFALFAILV